ncbi:metallophosphoesterase [Photobacterium sp. ZSDE20]|uniref:Metallophosphoesterase n=1 Tax=Photobacterium pectinilyticum TaxID=2906793 RepID=A0ABT1NCN6_9GAMM|nr:metallophosphoesterase [Photobacterium sp. ZSDE20]MCQ1061104.1 metallophosphoesterase [Photobacterium sp. ZSDE20]MDD1829236.1 metallophosphoesterase [Photobacterium sp. ZSDE20]
MDQISWPKGSVVFVGDIQGQYHQLQAALDKFGFDRQTDLLVCCGDLIDKGDNSYQALSLLNEPYFRTVLGNHDQCLLNALNTVIEEGVDGLCNPEHQHWFYANGGEWFLEPNMIEACLEYHDALQALPVQLEVIDSNGIKIGVTHGGYDSSVWQPLADNEYSRLNAIWSRSPITQFQKLSSETKRQKLSSKHKVSGCEAVCHGHTPVDKITVVGSHVYLDSDSDKTSNFNLISSENVAELVRRAV